MPVKLSANLKIRNAVPEDAAAIVQFLNIAGGESDFLTFGGGEFHFNEDEEREFINDLTNGVLLLAYVAGDLAGVGSCFGNKTPRLAHVAELGVSVLKKFWDLGIGSSLVAELLKQSKDKGFKRIELRVREDNSRAVALYEKAGFRREGLSECSTIVGGVCYNDILMAQLIA